MKPVIDDFSVATGLRCGRDSGRIGRDTRDPQAIKHRSGFVGEPCFVPRLEHDVSIEAIPQLAKERLRDRGVVSETRWQLDQNRTALGTESRALVEKTSQLAFRADQPRGVGNSLGQLYREPELVGDGRGPSLIGREAVRPVKARIDLDGVENSRVALKMGASFGKPRRVLSPNAPAGNPDVSVRGRELWNIRVQPPSLCLIV